MPNGYDLAQQFRQALLRQERDAAAQLVTAYAQASERLQTQTTALLVQIQQARAQGQIVNLSWLHQALRLNKLQAQVTAEISRLLPFLDATITAQQQQAITLSQTHAQELMLAGLGPAPLEAQAIVRASFQQLPIGAIETMVGFSSDGAPLRQLLSHLPGDASARVTEALTTAIIVGQHPRQTARDMQDALGGNLSRALTISRTETVRAYREATRQTYEQNSEVVTGWTWIASLTSRSCLACVAMHGTEHKSSERLNGHPNCRCVMVPITKSWAELGFTDIPDNRRPIEKGVDWFARQPASVQAEMMSKEALAAYQAGKIQLKDFVGVKRSQQWGSMRFERSTKDALQAAQKRGTKAGMFLGVPQNITVKYGQGAEDFARELLGQRLPEAELAALAGALDGSTVHVSAHTDGLFFNVQHPDILFQQRRLSKDELGRLYVRNLYIEKQQWGRPLTGLRALLRQIEFGRQAGVQYLSTSAAGKPGKDGLNGFYTWARYGFEAELPENRRRFLPDEMSDIKTLNELMQRGGADWWDDNGIGLEMTFDLAPNSSMMKTLLQYLAFLRKEKRWP